MNPDHASVALARIEAALSRIEERIAARFAHRDGRADSSLPDPGLAGSPPPDAAERDDLQLRHDRLRAVVQDSLDQLHHLIQNAPGINPPGINPP